MFAEIINENNALSIENQTLVAQNTKLVKYIKDY